MDDETMEHDDLGERAKDELRERFPSARFPEDEIEERIRTALTRSRMDRGRSRWVEVAGAPPVPWWNGATARTVLAVAASLVLFIGGVEYGRRTTRPYEPSAPARDAATLIVGSTPALSIQDAGSRYVASLARFSGEAGSLSPSQRRVAREVALAAIYGATLELLRESQGDETLEEVANMVATRREQISADTLPNTRSY